MLILSCSYKHIQNNVDTLLSDHPYALVVITGDFNPNSTGSNSNGVKQLTGVRHIIEFAIGGAPFWSGVFLMLKTCPGTC